MFLPVEGWGGNYRACANCADGCEWRDTNVLVVCSGVLGLGGVEEVGIDEVAAVDGEVDYGAVNGPFIIDLAEVGVGVPRCGTTCGRLELDADLIGDQEGDGTLEDMRMMSRREWVCTFWAGGIVHVPAVARIGIDMKDFF